MLLSAEDVLSMAKQAYEAAQEVVREKSEILAVRKNEERDATNAVQAALEAMAAAARLHTNISKFIFDFNIVEMFLLFLFHNNINL